MLRIKYEAIEIDGKWFVIDHTNPDAEPYEAVNERDAWISAGLWNLLEGYNIQKQKNV